MDTEKEKDSEKCEGYFFLGYITGCGFSILVYLFVLAFFKSVV